MQPDLVFSKGGFVAVPVVWGAFLNKVPVIIHESDASPGLATKLCAPFAKQILLGYKEAALSKYSEKSLVVGNPVREDIFKGSKKAAKKWTGFKEDKPLLLVMGGSLGAAAVNKMIDDQKEELTTRFNIVHIRGKGKGKQKSEANYKSAAFLGEELSDVYTITDYCISRAGAGSLAELEALGIPSLLFPLGSAASRGDQHQNARASIAAQKAASAGATPTLFALGNEASPLLPQLLALPKRSTLAKTTSQNPALERILKAIYSALKSA